MRKFLKIFMIGLAIFLFQTAIHAQITTGSLSGTVTDPNGAIVAGANVTIKNVATGEGRSATASDKGLFAFVSLQPGVYSVTVESKGFKRAVASDIAVEVSKEAEVTIKLEIGGANESVTVTAAQEIINTSSPSLTNVINTKQVVDLPLAGRNPLDLAALQAGIAVTGSNTRNASVSGLRGSATNVTQDGINAMDNFVKTASFFAISAPTLGSTEEFSITTGTTGSESGRGVTQVSVVTKGGTNQFHGSLFYQTLNSAFNANNFFNNLLGPKADGTAVSLRPDQHQHFYGGTIGGPVYFLKFGEGGKHIWDGHNKAFFFFTYEGFREKFQATRNRTVLTAQARTGLFRYTGTNGALQTVNLLAIGSVNTLNPITSAILNAQPASNNTLVGDGFNTAGYQFNVVGADPSDKFVGRYDHQLVENTRFGSHKFEFVYNRAKFKLFPDTFNGIEAPFPGGVDAGQSSIRTLYTGALVSTFGTATNVFRYGKQFAPVAFLRASTATAPYTVFASVTDTNNTFQSQGRNTIVNQFSDNFSLLKGAHSLRFGADYQKIFADTFNDAGINPTINFGTNPSNPTGITLASFPFGVNADVTRATNIYTDLVGLLGSASATFNVTSPTSGFVQGATRSRIFQEKDLAIFAQDQWRARSNLTLNYGVRWEFEGVPTVPNGLAIQPDASTIFGISGFGNVFRPNAPAGAAPGIATQNLVSGNTGKGLYKNDFNNFAPFVGLAYSPNFKSGPFHVLFGDEGKSSIRLGYAISYLHDGFSVISNALGVGVTNPGLIQSGAVTTPTGVLTAGGVPLPTPVFTLPLTDRQNNLINPSNGLYAIDPNLRTPYVQQWNVGYEREIAKNTAIEVRYVGNHAVKVYRAADFNEVNIFENGFLREFLNAQTNLALNGGVGFADAAHGGAAGTVALPILSNFFTGFANTSTSGFRSSGFIGNLNNNNVGAFANTLAFSNTYRTNRENPALGIPANFFVANPNAAFAVLLGNDSSSNYHALQVEFRRRFSQGLQFQANYTFSKALTDATAAAGSQTDIASFRSLRNKRLDYIRSNQDQTHRFVANAVYELPFGKGKSFLSGANGVLNQIVGGWTVGGIVTLQGRPPFFIAAGRSTFNCSPSRLATSNGCTVNLNPAQLVGISFEEFKKNLGVFKTPAGVFFINPNLLNITTNPTTGRFVSSTLKPGLLGPPAPGTFGNFPLNALSGPRFFNLDLSVTKRFKVKERIGLELKTTFINALNHPNFAFPTSAAGANVTSFNFDSTSFGQVNTTSGNDRSIHFIGTLKF